MFLLFNSGVYSADQENIVYSPRLLAKSFNQFFSLEDLISDCFALESMFS